MKKRIDLMVNKECNIDCLFCYHKGFINQEYDFSQAKIKSTLLYGKLNNIKELYISGGEPTISNNLIFALQIAKDYGYNKVKIMTNGLIFSDIEYCKKLKNLGVTNLAMSMHGHNKEIFELHAGVKNTYEKFVKGLFLANKFFDVDLNVVVTKQNIKHLNKQAKMLLTLGIKKIHLQHVVPNSSYNNLLLPSADDVKKYVNEFIFFNKSNFNITLEFFPYCLIDDKNFLGRFNYNNDFITNTPNMFDNWSNGILDNKIVKDECNTCLEFTFCKGFWNN